MSIKIGRCWEDEKGKNHNQFTVVVISPYIYSYLEFAQFVVLKHFQTLKNNYIINLQMTRILKKKKIHSAK